MKPDSLTVLPIHWAITTVHTLKMLELDAQDQHFALKELSDSEEATIPSDVWKCAIITSGEQSVMTFGMLLMQ